MARASGSVEGDLLQQPKQVYWALLRACLSLFVIADLTGDRQMDQTIQWLTQEWNSFVLVALSHTPPCPSAVHKYCIWETGGKRDWGGRNDWPKPVQLQEGFVLNEDFSF